MLKMVGCAAICSLALGLVGLAHEAAAGEALDLQNGKYELRLLTPQMAEGKKDITLPAEVESKDDEIVVQTQGMMGNKVTLRGMASGGTIKVGMTEVEGSSIMSFHYIGKVQTEQQAKGKFHCFIDGKAAFAGEWVLTKKETAKDGSCDAIVPNGFEVIEKSAGAPVEARLIAKKSKYVLPEDWHGEAFRKWIIEETDVDKLPQVPKVNLVLELKNVSKKDVMIWPGGIITAPELEIDGAGVVGPENLKSGRGAGSGGNVQPTISPGGTYRIPINSLNPGGGTPLVFWSEPGEYMIKASYFVYTGLPAIGLLDEKKPEGKPKRYKVTTPPITVQVLLEGDRDDG